ncbi:MAG: glycosyltransferase family 1 protein [Patescibacteria group bacterium]
MKIAIDCRYVLDPTNGQFGGISEYTDGLVRALLALKTDNKFVLFFSDKYSGDLAGAAAAVEIVRVPVKRGNFFFNHFSFPRLVRSYRPDIFFVPHGQLPLGWKGKAVITVHDLAIYDHPEWFPGGFSHWFSTKLVVPRSLRCAEKIVSVSEATKKDLIRLFKISGDKVAVVYPAVTVTDVPSKRADKYFLCLGTIEPRKNFILAAHAIKIFHEKFPEYKLLVAGKRGWKYEAITDEFVGADFIQEIGYVSPEEKLSLLAGAQALIFPSLYEGFGLPPLEAMTIGIPVITTRAGALPEVCGEAVRYVATSEPNELAQAMEEMTDEATRRGFIEKGLIQAKEFSWLKTAERLLKVF